MAQLSYQFEYAASSRGSCKKCGGGLTKDELIIGREVKGRFHDGIEVQKNHFDCISGTPAYQNTKLSTTKHWRRLRWEDQQIVRESLEDDCPLDESKIEKLEQLNEQFWTVRDKLEDVQGKILKDFCAANGRVFDDKKVSSATVLDCAADLMAFGRIMACPKCHQDSLINKHHFVYCNGNITDYEKCEHKIENYDEVKRYAVNIPDKIKIADKKGIFKNWKFDEDFPKEAWKNEEGGEEEKMEEENGPEDEIEDDLVLRGMKIIVIGTQKNLDGSVAEYNEMILQYGGEIAKNVLDRKSVV